MAEAAVNRFQRLGGDGETVEYHTPDPVSPQILAYLDFSTDGTRAAATVFYPHSGRSREYSERSAEAAQRIIDRHLISNGYTGESE